MRIESIVEPLLIGALPRREAERLAEQIAGAVGNAHTVEVQGARMAVETVEAYGLTIDLDSSGNAVAISAPAGLVVAG